ncbi:MFS transporter [Pseudonocardia phyllosphaerae]|uniref:MFS transporter n=1 Tax=Pseudonocardia phyllosphaerae TaxID=3390502 RepID=UPI00397E29D6
MSTAGPPDPTTTADAQAPLVRAGVRAATVRLLPLLFAAYLLNYVDRVNVGFAALTMNADLGLSAAAYGLGAGLFFIGYFFFEVPSNIILHKVGARLWIARIMVTWGIVASATAFVQGEIGFYVVRVLLGVAEAGFFPGVLLYLTYWFPRVDKARIVALLFLAVPLSSVIGSPVSTWLISLGEGTPYFAAGWRFMFFVEGIPAVLIGIAVLFLLPDRPAKARWLPAEQARALETTIDAEAAAGPGHDRGVRAALTDLRVLALSAVYFGVVFGLYVLAFFLPKIIKDFQQQFGTTYSLVQIGLVTAIPYAFASVAMVLSAWHSDRTGERALHVAVPAVVGAAAIAAALYTGSPLQVMVCVTICAMGVFAAIPPFWALPDRYLTGAAAAAGIGLVNSFGNLSGFAGPFVSGWLQDLTGSAKAGMWVVAALMVVSAMIALGFRQRGPAARSQDR